MGTVSSSFASPHAPIDGCSSPGSEGDCAQPHGGASLTAPGVAASDAFRPVFVVGCERSGTTLMAVLLDRHPELAMTPETFFFQKVVPRDWHKRQGDHDELLARFHDWFMARDLALNADGLRRRFSQYAPTYATLFRAVMEEYAILHGKPRAGEKTPFHLWQVPMLLEWFPEARVIGMMRDGRDVVLSILKMPWTTHQIIRLHSLKWIRTVKTELEYQRRYPNHFKMVRYEELLADPERQLREIDAFIGLKFSPAQLEAGKGSDVVIERALGYKADAMTTVDSSRVAGWKKKATREQVGVMNSMMGPMLRTMNYPDADMAGYSAGQKLRNAVADIACRVGLHRLWYNLFLRKAANRRRQAEEKKLAEAGAQATPR